MYQEKIMRRYLSKTRAVPPSAKPVTLSHEFLPEVCHTVSLVISPVSQGKAFCFIFLMSPSVKSVALSHD